MPRVQISKRPLLPVIELKKNDGGTYTFNPLTGMYDFRPHFVSIKPPIDKRGGKFTIHTSSLDASISAARTLLDNIEEGNEVLFYIGKTDATKTKILRGVIESLESDENVKDYMNVKIEGPDWGSDVLKHRVVNGSWTQKKQANGIDVDPTDFSTTIKNLVLAMLQDSQSYPIFDGITVESQGVVVNTDNITPPTIQIPQFEANMEFIDDKLSELDDYGFCTHYVDPDKNFKMHNIFSSESSGVMLVDDYEDPVALAYDQTKIGLLKAPTTYKQTVENHLRRMFGLGADQILLDQKQETVSHSTNLDANFLAQKFRPIYTTCHSIGVYIGKQGTPPQDMLLWLIEDDGGAPGITALRTMSRDRARILTAGDWTYFPIGEKLNVASDYWIVIVKTGDASNTFKWFRDNGSSHVNAYSANGTSWTVQSGSYGFAFRQYTSSPLLHYSPAVNLASQKHFHEETFRRPDINTKATMIKYLTALSASRFPRKVIIKSRIRAPDTLLLPMQTVRIRKTKGKQIDTFMTLGEVEYLFQGDESTQTGSFDFEIQASMFATYA